MPCILDQHWTKTYAPECADLPLGTEYGARLCRNYMYQHMIDHCIKGKCNDGDRRTVFHQRMEDGLLMVGTRVGEGYV